MNVTYTKKLGRNILLVFLVFIVIFSLTGFFVRNAIAKKLADVSKLANNIELSQSRPQQAMLLLQQAEGDFQESLLNADSNKISNYKIKLAKAFSEIDTLLKEKTDTSRLTSAQTSQVKIWYKKKIELSDRLYRLKNSFDALLNMYDSFQNTTPIKSTALITTNVHSGNESVKNNIDTTSKTVKKKGLFGRLKDAISNKTNNSVTEINHDRSINITSLNTQRIAAAGNGKAYEEKLHQLQRKNAELLHMQKELFVLNNHINNEMESIINDLKDVNYTMSDEFKTIALKNYQETSLLLNKFYFGDLFLVLAFAISLIIFIIQLNKSEMKLRKENELSINNAQEKIDELMKKIMLTDGDQSASRTELLKEVLELAVSNSPAFLIKFNEYDTGFSKKLLNMVPTLIAAEIEFCALLRLNFETKEIARYTRASVRAVEGKKYRVRKKLNIPSDQDINIWIANI